MTGPLGPMDDEGVVDLLRAAGRGGPEPSPDDVSRAISQGRRIRRRRQTMQILGSGLAMVAVLGVGITTVSALDEGKDGTTVTASADDAPATPVPTVVLAGKYLTEDLGEGWINTGTSATLDPKSELAALLPDGNYRAEGTASLIDRAAYEAVCEKKAGRNTCERVETSDGNTIWLWDWADRDLASSELKGEASAYRAIGADRYVLVTIAVVGTDVSAPERESHIDTVSAWFASQEGGLRKAVTDERIEDSLLAESSLATPESARAANTQLLLESLGPDFRVNTGDEEPGVTLLAGSPSAAGLPDGYDVTASLWILGPGDGYPGLEDLCTEMIQEGLRRSSCEVLETSDGRTAQVQTRRFAQEDGTTNAYTMLLAFFERSDGLVVEARIHAVHATPRASAAGQAGAATWLDRYRDTIVELAADRRVRTERT